VGALVGAGSIPDYSMCWWDVRPHPRLGTVELRAPDTQTETSRIASLAALTQCIVATADEHQPENRLFTEENKWRATRYGLEARFHDFTNGHTIPARQAVRDLVRKLRPVSQDLGCETQLDGVLEITEGETGAEKQRVVFENHGSLDAVVAHLIAATS
jgi:glutamate---cysteine ligase / carboxylate-amine ligase